MPSEYAGYPSPRIALWLGYLTALAIAPVGCDDGGAGPDPDPARDGSADAQGSDARPPGDAQPRDGAAPSDDAAPSDAGSEGAFPTDPGYHVRTVESGGLERTVALYIPNSFSRAAETPLYFVFHGGGPVSNEEKLRSLRARGFEPRVDAEGGVVVYPAAGHPGEDDTLWNDGRPPTAGSDDVAFIADLIERLDRQLGVDRRRVFATGASNGGMFSFRLACELAGTIAAVAPVIAALPEALEGSCDPSAPISMLALPGTADPFITYGGGDASHDGVTTNPNDDVSPRFEGSGAGGAILSADATRQHWASVHECEATPRVERLEPQTAEPRTTVYRYLYRECRDGARIDYYAVDCMGHTWPAGIGSESPRPSLSGWTSEQIDATERIWDFFHGETRSTRAVAHEGAPGFACGPS